MADRKWVVAILRWVVVASNDYSNVNVLQEAVEWGLQDTLPELQRFLGMECGSFLYIYPAIQGRQTPVPCSYTKHFVDSSLALRDVHGSSSLIYNLPTPMLSGYV
jgi:hypothetical protein